MAFVSGFDYDIFISYAHIDNVAFPGQPEGWILQFYKNLNLMLAKRFGRMDMVKIWWDEKRLDGGVVFNPSIEEGIKKSAVMICLYSPGYIASDYCKSELEAFCRKAQSEKYGLKVSNRTRIINVLLNNIPHEKWPAELSGATGFQFHDSKTNDEFGNTVETTAPEFRAQMQKLLDSLWKLLTEFNNESVSPVIPVTTAEGNPGDEFTIYLGEVADTLRTPRKRLISELKKSGFSVIAGIPPPDEEKAHEEATNDALKKANLIVHLLDEFAGREIEGIPDMTYPQKQAELGLLTGKPQIIWVPSEMDYSHIEENKYKTFLNNLETGKTSTKGYEFVRGSKSTVAQEIIDFATQLKSSQASKSIEKGKVSVLVDTHLNDQMYALDLCKALVENQVQPFINPQEDDPRQNMNLLNDRISQVKKLIFLYGNVSKEWVLERMNAALQLIINNNYPIENFFIYMAPPHKSASDISIKQKFLKVNVVDSSNNSGLDKSIFNGFLNDLKTNQG